MNDYGGCWCDYFGGCCGSIVLQRGVREIMD